MKRQEKIAALLNNIDKEEQNSSKKDEGKDKKDRNEENFEDIEDIEDEDIEIEDIKDTIDNDETSYLKQQISERDTTIKQLQELMDQQSQEQQRFKEQLQVQEQQTKILQSQTGKILEFLQNQSKIQNQPQPVNSTQKPIQQSETRPANTEFDFKTLLTPELVSSLVMRLLTPPTQVVSSAPATEIALSDMSKIFLEGGKMANSSLSQAIELVKALKG